MALLLATGACLGLLPPFARLSHDAGIDPFLWAAMISLVPGASLAIVAFRRGCEADLSKLMAFGLASGILAYVVPNAILFIAIPHIGAGLAGLMYALSPVATAIISGIFGIRPPNRAMIVAVALGFMGAVLIVVARNSLAMPSAARWLVIALIVPLSLAIGNVYRTAKWPERATPLQIGAVSNLLAAPLLLLASVISAGQLDVAPLWHHLPLAIFQWLASLAMFSLFFRLQWIGGPTYLSQIGYVAAAVSLLIGVFAFGETYPALVWSGAGLIIAGIVASAWDVFGKHNATAK